MLKPLLLAVLLLLCPLAAPAQDAEADKGYLVRLLEENLSSAGRQVTITGFAGALSSRASIQSLSIADDRGIWITLNGVVLDWSRSALLRGVVNVSELSADEIILTRPPVADQGGQAEAKGFALPDLPVSVRIGQIAARRIALGPAVLGEAVEARLTASLTLAAGEGQAKLELQRSDAGPRGRLALDAAFSNQTGQLRLNLTAAEDAGGLALRKLGIPGAPATELTIAGSGPLDDFGADIALRSAGQDRLAGRVTLTGGAGGRGFLADLSGDLAPLFLPRYAAFFGPHVRLRAEGVSRPDGSLDLSDFDLTAQAVHLTGAMVLDAARLPRRVSLQGRIGLPGGGPVLLPLGTETRLRLADLSLGYDAGVGQGWRGRVLVEGLDRPDLRADRLALNGNGTITAEGGLSADLRFAAEGVLPAGADLAAALGRTVRGSAKLASQPGGAVQVDDLVLTGADYAVTAKGRVDGLAQGFRLDGQAQADLRDLGRLSGLAGRPLGGAARLDLRGAGSLLGGEFDVTIRGTGTDLTLSQPQADGLLAGQSVIAARVIRDTAGTRLQDLQVSAGPLTARADGRLTHDALALQGDFALSDLSRLGPGWDGAARGEFSATGRPDDLRLTARATGRDLQPGNPGAARLLAGTSLWMVALGLTQGRVTIDEARLTAPRLTARATGRVSGAGRDLDLSLRLADLALFVPEFPGPVTVEGRASDQGGGYALDLRARGPGQIDAAVTGQVAADLARADLRAAGTLQAGILSPFLDGRILTGPVRFDLGMQGPLALSSVTGRVALTGGRLADPKLAFGLQNLSLRADLGGGRARISAQSGLSDGGTLAAAGTLALAPPFDGDLDLTLTRAVLRDPRLFQTVADGRLQVTGPLTGGAMVSGRISLGATEVQVPSTGLGGVADLPDLRHLNEPAPVRATRDRAGLLGAEGGPSGNATRPLGLNVTVSAPAQVFVRGRGLDAELGGALTLGGTTAAIIPAGSFELIRGRLDILGRRLVLSEATLTLAGNFVPTLAIAASTESEGITTTVRIDGPATGPEVHFTASPELPEEEVLARLLFGRGLENLSPLQAAQLANAVATLAGRGGVGVIGRLRQGFGLDDLDVQTDATGATSLTLGKYIAKNVYTEVEVGQDGQSKVNLNLDLSPSLTLRGTAGAAQSGEQSGTQAGVGLFFERDY